VFLLRNGDLLWRSLSSPPLTSWRTCPRAFPAPSLTLSTRRSTIGCRSRSEMCSFRRSVRNCRSCSPVCRKSRSHTASLGALARSSWLGAANWPRGTGGESSN
jgi:hypothetical protein